MKDKYLMSIPKDLKKTLSNKAELKGVSLNAFILSILWDYLEMLEEGE